MGTEELALNWWYLIPIVVTLMLFIFIYARYLSLKTHLSFITNENLAVKTHNQNLTKDNLQYIAQIERLTSKCEYLNKIIAESENNKQTNFTHVKAALFDLGGELSKQLLEIHKNETKEARELSNKNLEETSKKFHGEFERLVTMIGTLSKDIETSSASVDVIKQSLLSPSLVGRLAEITLENILKSSGLRERLDFSMQYTIKNVLDNSRLRPDAIIFLPAGNLMIIDAKASKFLIDDVEKVNLSKTMNTHLKALSSKEYAENTLIDFERKGQNFSNIITLMFLPTEQAVEKILESDHSFIQKAWGFNIFPVGPMGLMNMLSFAKFQICEQQRIENHNLILEEVKKIIKSIDIITDYSEKLGSNIQNLVSNYDKFAGSFNHNFLSKVKNIQKLGMSKSISRKEQPTHQLLNRYHLITSKAEGAKTEEEGEEVYNAE